MGLVRRASWRAVMGDGTVQTVETLFQSELPEQPLVEGATKVYLHSVELAEEAVSGIEVRPDDPAAAFTGRAWYSATDGTLRVSGSDKRIPLFDAAFADKLRKLVELLVDIDETAGPGQEVLVIKRKCKFQQAVEAESSISAIGDMMSLGDLFGDKVVSANSGLETGGKVVSSSVEARSGPGSGYALVVNSATKKWGLKATDQGTFAWEEIVA